MNSHLFLYNSNKQARVSNADLLFFIEKILLKLGEVLNGADHLAGVGVLVVIPGNYLNLIGVVVDLGDHGLVGIEERAVGHADDIRGDELLGGISEGLGALSLHGGVDGFLGDILALYDSNEDGGGTGEYRNALSGADELAVELRDYQTDGLGSAGGVRNDVGGAGTGTLQIALAVRTVEDHLIAGVGMNGGHDTGNDRISIVEGLGHWSEAVGGAGSGGDDGVIRLQGVVVYVVNDSRQIVSGRSGDDDFLGAGVDMSLRLGLAGIEAGALKHYVNIEGLPGEILSLRHGVYGDFLAVNGDRAGNLYGLAVFFELRLLRLDGVLVLADNAAESLLSGVILEKMSEHSRAGKVVDSDDLIAGSSEHLTESETADTAKTVNGNSYGHFMYSSELCVMVFYWIILYNIRLFFSSDYHLI